MFLMFYQLFASLHAQICFIKNWLEKAGKKTSIKQPQYTQFKHMMTSDIQYVYCIMEGKIYLCEK